MSGNVALVYSGRHLRWLGFFLLTGFCSVMQAAEPERSMVMLVGTFHFADAGLDQVKGMDVDVMTPENQAYLEALATRLSQFKPTRVLLEYEPATEIDQRLNDRYQAYLQGEFALRSNEIYQLGFRIAKAAGLARIDGFDDRGVGWDAQPLFDYMKTVDLSAQAARDERIARITEKHERNQATLDLRGLLLNANDSDEDQLNMSLYVLTNQVGTDAEPVGATAAATWWHRNFRMFARIQRFALAAPEQRVLVISGQGHNAILKTLLALDERLEAVDPVSLL